ncbi:MAG: hypothetical protein ACLQFT_03890 [Steroidobacteraceae bacterium]|jgi:hypothetical protein
MTMSSSTVEAARALERRWNEATVAVIFAQVAYAELESHGGADDGTVVTAWLRLWRAHERQLSAELDRVSKHDG